MKTRASAQDISEPALRCAMHIGKMIKCKEGSVSQSKAMQSQQEAECPSCKQKKLRDYSISRRAEDPLQPRLSGFVCQLPRGYVRHLRHRHRHHHHHQHRHLCCNIIAALAVNRHDNHFDCSQVSEDHNSHCVYFTCVSDGFDAENRVFMADPTARTFMASQEAAWCWCTNFLLHSPTRSIASCCRGSLPRFGLVCPSAGRFGSLCFLFLLGGLAVFG